MRGRRARELRLERLILRLELRSLAVELVDAHVQLQDGDVQRDDTGEQRAEADDPEDAAAQAARVTARPRALLRSRPRGRGLVRARLCLLAGRRRCGRGD